MASLLVIEEPDLDAVMLNGRTAPPGFDWLRVPDASSALTQLERQPYALVLAGPRVASNGSADFLTLVRQQYPRLPVVVLTGESDATARDALRTGIAGCLPKQNISTDLARTLKILLNPTASHHDGTRVCYTLDNSPDLLPLVVGHMRSLIQDWPFTDPHELDRVSVALSEALDNALYHGNLELDSVLRQGDGCAWRQENQRRRTVSPYRDRRIRFHANVALDAATFTVSDEGVGFDPSLPSDCTDSDNLELCSGRGLMLMRMYMDQVIFNASGNEVTLMKRRPGAYLN
jgi:anti-sigma regulatory factor (Ser/Thr protein kinase)